MFLLDMSEYCTIFMKVFIKTQNLGLWKGTPTVNRGC